LQYLLTTNVTTWEIVIGKLLGRLTQLALLALAGLPLLCLMAPFTGFNLITILALVVFTILVLIGLGSASMLASVWSRQTRDAVIALYGLGLGGILLVWGAREVAAYLDDVAPAGSPPCLLSSWLSWLDAGLIYFDPRFVLAPSLDSNQKLPELARRMVAASFA